VTPSNPWLRLIVGIVCVAVAIRVVVDLLRPIAGFLLAVIVLTGLVIAAHWWRNNRW
jgi:hypothetical protein